MPSAVKIRSDYSAAGLRRLAAGSKDANQSRRLLSLAAVLDGMSREEAARIGGMDRQTLRIHPGWAALPELRFRESMRLSKRDTRSTVDASCGFGERVTAATLVGG